LDNEIVFEKRCASEDEQFINFECEQGWNKRIENNNFNKSLIELEDYIKFNNNISEEE
jgi:hypothetical protein